MLLKYIYTHLTCKVCNIKYIFIRIVDLKIEGFPLNNIMYYKMYCWNEFELELKLLRIILERYN